jgi:hypothetical protein
MSGALIWVVLAVLAVAGGVGVRRKLGAALDDAEHSLDDEAIRRIVDTGSVVVDQDPPLDLDEIEEEEERFWSETWDEPEDW